MFLVIDNALASIPSIVYICLSVYVLLWFNREIMGEPIPHAARRLTVFLIRHLIIPTARLIISLTRAIYHTARITATTYYSHR